MTDDSEVLSRDEARGSRSCEVKDITSEVFLIPSGHVPATTASTQKPGKTCKKKTCKEKHAKKSVDNPRFASNSGKY